MQSRRSFLRVLGAGSLAAGTLPALGAVARPDTPDFVDVDGWINTATPLTLTGLRGQVVLVDFWTYSCINCRRTVRYLNRWQADYGGHGLQVVGIHTPEFGFEHARHNVADAVRECGIRYPVGQDNGYRTWQAWNNRAWPAFYLLDRSGRIVLVREGEGHARELEAAIRALLGLLPSSMAGVPGDDPDLSRIGTAEIYFGSLHGTPQDRKQQPRRGEVAYSLPATAPRSGEYQLEGTWLRQDEGLVLRSASGRVRVRFSAAKFHLVAAAPQPTILRATVNGVTVEVEVARPTLYTLLDGDNYREHELTIQADRPGLSLFSATFG